jgi:hypothetical protein
MAIRCARVVFPAASVTGTGHGSSVRQADIAVTRPPPATRPARQAQACTRRLGDAHSRIAELDVTGSHGVEEGPTITHHDGHRVVANLVEQPELEAMTGDGAGGDRDMTFAGSGSRLLHRFRYFAGDEGEGCVRGTATQSAGSRWVTTTTGTFMVCRPS